jgi:hypothetical protein
MFDYMNYPHCNINIIFVLCQYIFQFSKDFHNLHVTFWVSDVFAARISKPQVSPTFLLPCIAKYHRGRSPNGVLSIYFNRIGNKFSHADRQTSIYAVTVYYVPLCADFSPILSNLLFSNLLFY